MDTLRKKHSEGKIIEHAVDESIDEMDKDSVLKEYLVKHRAGVKEIMFDEKSIEEMKEKVDRRINELETEVSKKDALLSEKDQQIVSQSEMLKEQGKNLSNAIAYVAKTLGISEKEAQKRIASRDSQSE